MSLSIRNVAAATLAGGLLTACVAAPPATDPAAAPAGPAADGLDRTVTVVNRSGQSVFRFYASNVATSTWEDDILGRQVLVDGQTTRIDFNDGTGYCDYDFRIEFRDGTTVEDYGVDVCAARTYTIGG